MAISIGAGTHWGLMSLQAATRGDVQVLAVEPLADNLPHLKRWVADNRLDQRVEVVFAAAAESPRRHRLTPRGTVPVVTIDALVARRPDHAGRRIIVRIDAEGAEAEAVEGMSRLLAAGRVAAVVWRHGAARGRPARRLGDHFRRLGFTAWHFADEDQAGPLLPFDETAHGDWRGYVVELAPGLSPLPCYGLPRPPAPAQPADDALDDALEARRLLERGDNLPPPEALDCYIRAAVLDPTIAPLWHRLGLALRRLGRLPAAIAGQRRAAVLAPRDAATLGDLADALREQGKLDMARALYRRARAYRPDVTPPPTPRP